MQPRVHINGPLTWSLIFMAAVVIAIVMMAPPVVRAAFSGGEGEADATNQIAQLMAEHERWQETYEKRFTGRSPFFKPAQPRPQPKPREITKEPEIEEPVPVEPSGPPPPPRNYTGPDIHAVVGELVMFAGALRISVGEEASGVKVLAIEDPPDSPLTVKLAHAGGTYDVPLWDKTIFDEAGPKTGIAQALSAPESKLILETPPANEGVATLSGDTARAAGENEPGAEADPETEAGAGIDDPLEDPNEELAGGSEDPAEEDPEEETPEEELAGGEDPEEEPAQDPEEDSEELAGANDPQQPDDQSAPDEPEPAPDEPAQSAEDPGSERQEQPQAVTGAGSDDAAGGADAAGSGRAAPTDQAQPVPPADDEEAGDAAEHAGESDDQDEPSPSPPRADDPNDT